MSHSHPDRGRAQKRAQFTTARTSKSKKMIPIFLIGLIGVGVYLVARNLGGRPASTAVTVVAPAPPSEPASAAEPAPPAEPATSEKVASSNEPATSGPSAGSDIAIPLADVGSGQAKFFEYVASNKTSVRFFVIKSSDGVYRAALDACDVCYRAKQGYQQSGDDMVCRKCGRHFPSALVNEVTGGCNPIAIARTAAGGKLLIKAAELEGMKNYF
jgi:hypothetical protein